LVPNVKFGYLLNEDVLETNVANNGSSGDKKFMAVNDLLSQFEIWNLQ
jgi:hypothetical protein